MYLQEIWSFLSLLVLFQEGWWCFCVMLEVPMIRLLFVLLYFFLVGTALRLPRPPIVSNRPSAMRLNIPSLFFVLAHMWQQLWSSWLANLKKWQTELDSNGRLWISGNVFEFICNASIFYKLYFHIIMYICVQLIISY